MNLFGNCEDVETIVMFYDDWQRYMGSGVQFNKKIAVHTINDLYTARELIKNGVFYIYTDVIM